MISHEISESLSGTVSPGQIRQYMRDLNSFNAGETATAGLGAVFMFLACHSKDPRAISRVTASNICLGIATGNPGQLLIGVAGLVYGLYHGKIKSYELLRGSAPIISGMLAYQTATKLFNISKNSSIMLSIGTNLTTEILLNHLEKRKEKKILEELGKNNPHYIVALTPDILSREFIKLSQREQKLPYLGKWI